jgi:hypothetical protein
MTIRYQFGVVDARRSAIRAWAASLQPEHQAIVDDAPIAADFPGGASHSNLRAKGLNQQQQHGQHR